MRDLEIMIKPASSLCNLRCSYCFYEAVAQSRSIRSHGIMSPGTVQAVLENTFCDLDPGDRISFAFQGGEPTLAGLDFFRDYIRRVQRLNRGCEILYRLQTNGILLDDQWCAFLKDQAFLIGLSLDCLQSVHDTNRKDSAGNGTFARVMETKEQLDNWKIDYNVLAVLTRDLAAQPEAVWAFLQRHRIMFVQFTPCFGDTSGALTPEDFAHFYEQLIPLWYNDWKKGIYISIKLIDDLVTLLATGQATACGLTGRCDPQIIVEASGDVYPCDFYAVDTWRIGNLCQDSIAKLYESPKQAQFRCRIRRLPLCGSCQYKAICGGNCPKMQKYICYGEKNSVCGMRELFDRCIGTLLSVAWQLWQ